MMKPPEHADVSFRDRLPTVTESGKRNWIRGSQRKNCINGALYLAWFISLLFRYAVY
jgi:hypothetical protein